MIVTMFMVRHHKSLISTTLISEVSFTKLNEGPKVLQCKENHPFLEAEWSVKCAICHADVCRFCFMEEKDLPGRNGKQLFCFECMDAQVICDVDGEEIT